MDQTVVILLLMSSCCCALVLFVGVAWVLLKKTRRHSTPASSPSSNTPTTSVEGSAVSNGDSGKTAITFYGGTPGDDNRLGLTGIDLDAHSRAGFTLNGKPVYPGAVHQYAGPKFLYKVLEVKGDVNPIYIHVVDVCDAKDSVCNKNVKANGNNFLVDIFQTGFKAAGKSDGILNGTYTVVGEIPASKIPKNVWKNEYVMPKCTGKCGEKERTWVKASSIK